MPIYEYRCEACTEVSEVQQSFKDPPLESCPLCGKGPMEKLISRTSFALKGSGFYTTDYKRSSSPSPTSTTNTTAPTATPATPPAAATATE